MQQNVRDSGHRQVRVVGVQALAVVNYSPPCLTRSAAEVELLSTVQGPQLIEAGSGNTGQLSVGPERGHDIGISVPSDIDTSMQSADSTLFDCFGQAPPGKSSGIE
ncbi:hypothetical protein [Paenarthrobacter sp. NPDC058040]|uniref:hypothetical protein n=1 Tax=unclassified Paenarthrobacter TaxID=2634190 RepID=UPI0036DE1D56